MEVASCVGAPVIIVPNEWGNPVVGFGKEIMEIGSSAVLVVENYLTGEDVVCGGVRMDYSRQKLEALLKLDPYERWAVLAVNTVGHENYDKPKSGKAWGKEQIIDKLESSGFFNRVREFLVEKNADDNTPGGTMVKKVKP